MRIKLMADYYCWPLWHSGGGEVGDIDPQSLPLTQELVSDLNGWTAKLDSALNRDDPSNTEWPDCFFVEFNREGRNLARRLKTELGSSYEVTAKFWGE